MIISLNPGQVITPIRVINRTMVSYWKYAAENADVSGGLLPGAELTIKEVSKKPGQLWVRAELPGRSPPATLKISGEEYALNFTLMK